MTVINQLMARQWRFWRGIFFRFFENGCSARAAALTFTSLLSLVPLMVVGFSIMSAFPRFQAVGPRIQDFIFQHFVASSGRVIKTYLQNFVGQASQLSALGFVFLIVAAVLMMFTMEKALNHIWRVQQPRHGVAAFLLYWAVLTISPILMGASVVVTSYITSLKWFGDTILAENHIFLFVSPLLLSCAAFSLFYVAIPHRKVPLKYGIIAGVFAAILFEFAKRGFAFYITQFQTYQLIYGALSAIPIFLVWLYVCWLIILLGAELSYALTYGYHRLAPGELKPFVQIYRWLGYLWQAQKKGEALSLEALVRLDGIAGAMPPEVILQWMLEKKLVQTVSGGRVMLSRDLTRLTLDELHKINPWRYPRSDELTYFNDPWEQSLRSAIISIHSQTETITQEPMVVFYQE